MINQSLVTLATPATVDTVTFGILSHLEAAYQRLVDAGDQEAAAWIENAVWEIQQLGQYVVDAKDIIKLAVEETRRQREEAVLAATVAADQRDQETAAKCRVQDELSNLRLALWSHSSGHPEVAQVIQAAQQEAETGIREDLIGTLMRITKINRYEVECFVDELMDNGYLGSPEAETVALALGKRVGG